MLVDKDKTPSLAAENLGNVSLVPQPESLVHLPWVGEAPRYSEAQVLCETRWLGSGLPQTQCPRYMAREQLRRLADLGYTLYSGFEAELMLLSAENNNSVFEKHKNFCYDITWSRVKDAVFAVDQALQRMGVVCQAHQLEYGTAQLESALAPSQGIKAADDLFHLRNTWKTLLPQLRPGTEVTFMTRPFPDEIGNGLHFGQSLRSCGNDENVTHDKNDPDKLSPLTRHWLAGLIKHAGAIVALTSPTYNCYRRLAQPWTPDKADWGVQNRTAAFRLCNSTPQSTYVECRLPGGSANPYLAMAVTVAAGIDGIVNSMSCPIQKDPDATNLPLSMPDALAALEEDQVIVNALGVEFVTWFKYIKQRELEILGGQHDIRKDVAEMGEKEFDLYKML